MGAILHKEGVILSDGAMGLQPAPPPPAPTLQREWLLLGISVALLLGIVAPPLVNLGRYQHRIVADMSRSLGREVTLRAVTLRLLPLPALVLSDVIVNEEPEFGAEPALRAPSVIAQLRLASLWRGRLEVSHVEISDASLNLVRDATGRWNVGAILLQASHVVNAPTGQRRAGPAPRFPYIEITDSRVNLKQGAEKLPYSLNNANLSMWLAEPELYQLRLDGQPVRTDVELGLSDTGLLRIEGSLHRATALGHMPLALHGAWTNAPLGQASRLLLGHDRGWRGDLHATADVSGDLDNLALKAHVLIANLHREEFTPSEPFAVDATCHAAYSRAAGTLSDLGCRWPIGAGQLLLSGRIASGNSDGPGMEPGTGQQSAQESTLALTVQQLPASFLVASAALARSDFSPAFHLEGELNGMLFYNKHGGELPLYAGVLEAPQMRMVAPALREPLQFSGVRLVAGTPAPSGVSTLTLTAAPLDLGGPSPSTINAQLTAQGFLLHTSGSAALARLEALGRATNLLPASLAWVAPQGMAEFDVTRSAAWQQPDPPSPPLPVESDNSPIYDPSSRDHGSGDAGLQAGPGRRPTRLQDGTAAVTNGWLRLRDVIYKPTFLAEPASLASVQASFSPGEIAWSTPAAIVHGARLQVSASYPLDCTRQPGCVTRFTIGSDALDAEALAAALLGGRDDRHLLDTILGSLGANGARWPALEGTVHAGSFTLGRLPLRNAEAELSIADGRASLRSLRAQTLGGALEVKGAIMLKDGIPHYELFTALTRSSASADGAFFHENWGGGSIDFSSRLHLVGMSISELTASAQGQFHAEWTRGGLGAQTPLARFALWTADGTIENQALTLVHAQLTPSPSGDPLPVTGTIAFDRALALHLAPPAPSGGNPGTGGGEKAVGANASAAGTDSAATAPNATVTGTLSKPMQ